MNSRFVATLAAAAAYLVLTSVIVDALVTAALPHLVVLLGP